MKLYVFIAGMIVIVYLLIHYLLLYGWYFAILLEKKKKKSKKALEKVIFLNVFLMVNVHNDQSLMHLHLMYLYLHDLIYI